MRTKHRVDDDELEQVSGGTEFSSSREKPVRPPVGGGGPDPEPVDWPDPIDSSGGPLQELE